MQVAIPEFDGRLITVPFSFKEQGPDDVPVYVADPERAGARRRDRRTARPAEAQAERRQEARARLHRLPDQALPRRQRGRPGHARVGGPGAGRARDAGYASASPVPDNGDELIHRLIDAGGHDVEWLTEEQLAAAPARVPLADYRGAGSTSSPELRDGMPEPWGEPPGSLYVDGDDIVLAVRSSSGTSS